MSHSNMLSLSLLCLLPVCWSSPLAGWLDSPGYPRGYEPHSTLTWSRCAPPGHTLSLTFIHLDIEDGIQCENDALKVYADGSLLSTLCGRPSPQELLTLINPPLHSSAGGCLNVSFTADYSNTERHTGFRAFYTVQDYDECEESSTQCSHFCHNFIGGYMCGCRPGYLLDANNHTCSVSCTEDLSGSLRGQVTPPGPPGAYAEEARCSYTLAVEEGLQLVIDFTGSFDVEARPNGECVDSIRVQTQSKTFGPFCGSIPPSPIDTRSSHARILFDSDSHGTNVGFTLTYKTKRMTCPGEVTKSSSNDPERSQYVMGDEVSVTCDSGTVLAQTAGQGIKSNMTYVSRCQKDGAWKPLYQCETVICEDPQLPFAVATNKPLSISYKSEMKFHCSSQYYQLESNEVFTCEADGLWRSNTSQTRLPKCVPICGQSSSSSSGRILGGKKAQLGQIPWQLLMKIPKRGGASLLNDRWAVTAAHVVQGLEPSSVTLYGGMVDATHKDAKTLTVEKIFIHPGYEKNPTSVTEEERTNYDNDIALIKMSSRVEIGPNLRPICLPETANGAALQGRAGTVSGYGQNDRKEKSKLLHFANINEYEVKECNDTPRTPGGRPLIFTNNMFCAGDALKHTDSCHGDSGGPVVYPMIGHAEEGEPYRLMGIVSWGASCRQRAYKGYYTKVQNYLDWIRETMQQDEE